MNESTTPNATSTTPNATSTTPMIAVESSQLEAIGYDAERQLLLIRFRGKGKPGGLYRYRNFSETDWAALRDAESKGSHFIRNIKPHTDRYPYERVDESASA